jgi:hypothetical protein
MPTDRPPDPLRPDKARPRVRPGDAVHPRAWFPSSFPGFPEPVGVLQRGRQLLITHDRFARERSNPCQETARSPHGHLPSEVLPVEGLHPGRGRNRSAPGRCRASRDPCSLRRQLPDVMFIAAASAGGVPCAVPFRVPYTRRISAVRPANPPAPPPPPAPPSPRRLRPRRFPARNPALHTVPPEPSGRAAVSLPSSASVASAPPPSQPGLRCRRSSCVRPGESSRQFHPDRPDPLHHPPSSKPQPSWSFPAPPARPATAGGNGRNTLQSCFESPYEHDPASCTPRRAARDLASRTDPPDPQFAPLSPPPAPPRHHRHEWPGTNRIPRGWEPAFMDAPPPPPPPPPMGGPPAHRHVLPPPPPPPSPAVPPGAPHGFRTVNIPPAPTTQAWRSGLRRSWLGDRARRFSAQSFPECNDPAPDQDSTERISAPSCDPPRPSLSDCRRCHRRGLDGKAEVGPRAPGSSQPAGTSGPRCR